MNFKEYVIFGIKRYNLVLGFLGFFIYLASIVLDVYISILIYIFLIFQSL